MTDREYHVSIIVERLQDGDTQLTHVETVAAFASQKAASHYVDILAPAVFIDAREAGRPTT